MTPPSEILQHGLATVREYLAALRAGEGTRRTIARVMFVGWASAGKTKLNHALRGTLSDWQDAETVGIDTAKWPTGWAGKKSAGIEFRSWDFAGQKEYYAMHRIFLTERAIYLLLVDVSSPPPSPEDPQDAAFVEELRRTVRFWLNSLTKSTKGALVQAVATKVDLIEPERVGPRVQLLLEQLREEERLACAELTAQLAREDGQAREKAQEALRMRPSLPKKVEDILLSGLSFEPVKKEEQPEAEDHELPPFLGAWAQLNQGGPHSQGGVESAVGSSARDIQSGAKYGGAVKGEPVAADLGRGMVEGAGAPAEGRARGDVAASEDQAAEMYLGPIRDALVRLARDKRFQVDLPGSYVLLMEAVEKRKSGIGAAPYLDWEAFEEELLKPSGLETKAAFQTATQLLHDLGIVLWYDETRGERYEDGQLAQDPKGWGGLSQRVFLDPQWVVDLLKPILGHQLEEQFLPIPVDRAKWGPYWQRFMSLEEAQRHREDLIQ